MTSLFLIISIKATAQLQESSHAITGYSYWHLAAAQQNEEGWRRLLLVAAAMAEDTSEVRQIFAQEPFAVGRLFWRQAHLNDGVCEVVPARQELLDRRCLVVVGPLSRETQPYLQM